MKEPPVVKDYIRDMLDAMDKAVRFVDDLDLSDFKQDEKSGYAVIRCLEIIGEAAKKVPLAVKRKHDAIPWKNLAGMRDKLIHDYAGVDMEIVFMTVKNDIPAVKVLLVELIEELNN